MKRQVPISSTFPYHVSARCPNRELFKIPLNEMWHVMEDYLYSTKYLFELNIHAFVLMPNHFHMLASTPKANIGPSMNYFMRETSKETNRLSFRINQTWGGPHYKSLVNSYHYFMNVYKYIYRNPVRAKLCDKVEDYPYSTLSGLLGKQQLIIPVQEDTLLFDPDFNQATLNWLNTSSCPKDEEEVRRALRRSLFEFRRDPLTGHESHLEKKLI